MSSPSLQAAEAAAGAGHQGPGSRKRGLLMAYELLRMAGKRWRRLNRSELLPLVRAGVEFTDGQQLE